MQAGNRPITRRQLDAYIQPRRRLAERHNGEETGLKGRRSGCRFVRLFLRNVATIFQEIGSKKRENALLMSEVRGQTGGVTFQLLALRQPAHRSKLFNWLVQNLRTEDK